jgi:dipeptidyl aminopeptidase/acylaminoacyl peptidase
VPALRPVAQHPDRANARRVRTLTIAAATAMLLACSMQGAGAQPVTPPDSLMPPPGSHPLGVRDLWVLDRVSDPQPSPDGSRVAYVRRHDDAHTNGSVSSLYVVPITGGEPRRLTAAGAVDTHPRWAPDGRRLAFLSDRSGTTQVWCLDLTGGEPQSLTQLPVPVGGFAWSPDGTRIAFTASVYPDCPTLECTRERQQKLEGAGVAARLYTQLLYRHWDTWDSGRRQHVFVLPIAGGKPVDVLAGADIDAPPPPFGTSASFCWSPDGTRLAIAGREHTASAAWTDNTDLYLARADGSGFRCITPQNLAVDALPAWSPDGHTLAYLAMQRPGSEADRMRVVLYDPAKGVRRVLTETWDRSPAELVWSPRGGTLYAVAPELARAQLFALDVARGEARKIAHPHSATALRVVAGGGAERLLFLGESLNAPADIYTCDPKGKAWQRLTETNAAALAPVRQSVPQEIWYEGAAGARVHAWLHPPVDRRAGEKVPLLLLIHGGPQSSWDDRWSYRWNPQVFAGAGYAVLAPDPHGSVGYGQEYADAVNGDWGGKPYEDLMRGVDYVLATVAWVDSTRIAAAGGSFGGYMVQWMAGHTRRFRCLVSHAGLFDLASFYGTTEEQWFPEWEFLGPPWEKPEIYARWSPSTAVAKWQTPMLLTAGAHDYRVPESQSFAAFTALQRQGVPAQLLWLAGENHFVLQPQNSVLWYDTVLAWLHRWLAPAAPTTGTAP